MPRITLLVSLLTLTAVLVASLAYEAHDAARSHRVTAERALRDYASVAAWEYVTNVQDRLNSAASEVLSPVTSVRASSPYELLASPDLLTSPSGDVLACAPTQGDSARIVFRVDLRDGSVALAGAKPDSNFVSWLRDTVVTHTRLRYRPEMRYAAVADPSRAPGRLVFYAIRYAQHGAPLAAYGFTSCPRAIGSGVLREAMSAHALLPGSVTGGAANDSLLSLVVTDPAGREWYRSSPATGPKVASPYASEVALDGAGIPLVVHAALRASAPELLLVGRPPGSRLPILLGLLALTAALAAVAAMQLRREHELARLRADFTLSVSHELRTPLAQILLFGETLELGRVRSDADRQLAVETIVHEARRLMHMVDNVLHFARTSEGRVQLELAPTDLGPLMDSILATFAPLAQERGVRVAAEVREPVTALADPGSLRQIVLNLLDNAIKFGPRGQTVRLIVERADSVARIAVEDDGPGIPLSDRERIWSPYVRLRREHSAANEGSGIGLAVVRELTELHRGAAYVEDSATGGARFVVEVPIAGAAPDASVPVPRAGNAPGKARDPQGWARRTRRQIARGVDSSGKPS
ncbi:MAG TPA: HAMP domain-containing sensor histidine kinase [Gemmatimonadaceae bacterium]|nr:HAMP domain-containing sensor histidine kinase [Gemmatimonadaceae bacterium]